ncbi:MAG: four helix bundle protein [Candidatus Omnitrophica bacterium]|nr:four helix bundle protein [Candidatus Omnitrophota bacterium]MBU1933076.1 four helix bundle protein [Candidatus Omnitrophota bacterium]
MRSFKDLKIWRKGIEIVKDTYGLTESFPDKELYGLTSQMRKAAVSLPSNIAEGFKRYHNKEYKQFLHIALGSAAELETQFIIAQELDYINKEELENISEKLDHLSKMITALIHKLR